MPQIPRVPVVMQMDELECGAASLAMMMGYYKKWIPLEQLRDDCGVSRDGVNAGSILRTAARYGLKAEGYRLEPDQILALGICPCIVHWNFNHFVVLKGIKNGRVYLNDPAQGSIEIPEEEFDKGFTGVTITVEPGEDFVPSGKPKSVFKFTRDRLEGTGGAIAFVALCTMLLSVCGLLFSGLSRFFMDELLGGGNLELIRGFTVSFLLLALIQTVTAWIQAVCSLRISGKFAAIGDLTYFWHVLTLPMHFFQHRTAGDIEQRRTYHARMAETLINTIAPLLMNGIMLIFYLIVIIRYSFLLSLVGISSIVINLFVSRVVSAKRINITRRMMKDRAKLYSATLSGINMIETIKSGGLENGFFKRWSGYQAGVNTQKARFLKLDAFWGRIPSFIVTLANTLTLLLGVKFVIDGRFTPGMVLAFQGLSSQFLAPAQSVLTFGQRIQELRTQMERVEDVMDYPGDEMFPVDKAEPREEEYVRLTGQISFKNVTFGFSDTDKPVINDISFDLEQGRSLAVVGHSGSGKSTIVNLIAGLYSPRSGQILMDGRDIRSIDRNEFKGTVAVVDQEIILFRDTIENNIRMWDPTIESFDVVMAARDACLHEDIMRREGGYQYMLTEDGRNLSGGERQRLEIARVLAQDPGLIVLDEATSALDARTESDVISAIKARGISCIVVAHRLSTIRDCDEIVVLDHGRIAERGDHESLMARNGIYKTLVTSS